MTAIAPRTLRILQVAQPPDGGVAAHVRLLTQYLVGRGHQVAIAAPPDSELAQGLPGTLPFFPMPSLIRRPDPNSDLRALVQLGDVMRGGGWDVVHLHSSKAGFVGRLATLGMRDRPVVLYTPHCFASLSQMGRAKRAVYRALERVVRDLGDGTILVSRWEYVASDSQGLLPHRRAWIVLNGASPRGGDVGRAADVSVGTAPGARGEADGPPEGSFGTDDVSAASASRARGFVVGTVTRLQPEKGTDDFVRMAAHVIREAPATRFVVVGDGPGREALRSLCRELGIDGRVSFTGLVSDVVRELERFDVFVLSSRQESLPLAVMEAMSLGVPVVATDVGGVGEIIRRGSGLTSPAGNPEALAVSVVRLLRDPGLRQRLAEAGLRRYSTRFIPAASGAATEALYLQRVALKRRP